MVAKQGLLYIAIAVLCVQASWANAEIKPASLSGMDSLTWQNLSDEQRNNLIKRYQDLRQLPDTERQDLQQRMDWFSQLSKDKQQRMREVWQNMSASEREHWKVRLKQASPNQRDILREKIMAKYDRDTF